MVNQTPRPGRKHSEPQILLAARAAGREFQQIYPPSAIHCSVFRATNHTTVLGDQTVWVCWCQLVAGPPVDLLPAGWSVHQLYPTREKIWREKSRWLRRGKKNVGKHRRYPNSGGQIHNSFDPPMFDEVKWSETSVTRKGPWRVQAWRKRRKLGTTTLTFCIFTRTRTESFAMFHRCLKNTTNKIAPWKRERLLSKHEISRIMTSNGKRQTVLRKGPTNDLRHLRCKHPFCACFGAWFGSRFFCCEMAGSNAHLFAQWLGL